MSKEVRGELEEHFNRSRWVVDSSDLINHVTL